MAGCLQEVTIVMFGNRRNAQPLLINQKGSAIKLKRIPLTEREFDEGWLQELVRENPEILPVSEIEPAFSPLVSIGREVETQVGYIDNMFLSPQGYLTIVETKLWRNPEARREVVGQIIDYAKDVSGWSYEHLENKVRKYNKQYRNSDLGIVGTLQLIEQIDENEELIIVDAISRNLRHGRLLLLIVGDGIRESVEAMADFLQQTPQLLFTLALVELQVYEIAENDERQLLVMPQIVSRTREITRAVVRVESEPQNNIKVSAEVPAIEESPLRVSKRHTLTESDFFNLLGQSYDQSTTVFVKQIMQDVSNLGCIIEWKQSSFVVKLADPGGSGQRLSLFNIGKRGEMNFGWLPGQLKSLNISEEIAFNFINKVAQLFSNVEVNPKYPDSLTEPIFISELLDKYNEFLSLLQMTIDQIRQSASE